MFKELQNTYKDQCIQNNNNMPQTRQTHTHTTKKGSFLKEVMNNDLQYDLESKR